MKLRLSFLFVSLLFCNVFATTYNNNPTNNEKPYTTQLTQKLAGQIQTDALTDLEFQLESIGIKKEINIKLEFNQLIKIVNFYKEKGTEENDSESTQVIVDDVVVMIYNFPSDPISLQNNLCTNSLHLNKDEMTPG